MKQVLFLAEARHDLDEIWLYIAIHDEAAANWLLDAIDAKSATLSHYPNAGPARSELGPELRSLSVPPFILYYRVAGEIVEIVRVIHAARDVSAIINQDQ